MSNTEKNNVQERDIKRKKKESNNTNDDEF